MRVAEAAAGSRRPQNNIFFSKFSNFFVRSFVAGIDGRCQAMSAAAAAHGREEGEEKGGTVRGRLV